MVNDVSKYVKLTRISTNDIPMPEEIDEFDTANEIEQDVNNVAAIEELSDDDEMGTEHVQTFFLQQITHLL